MAGPSPSPASPDRAPLPALTLELQEVPVALRNASGPEDPMLLPPGASEAEAGSPDMDGAVKVPVLVGAPAAPEPAAQPTIGPGLGNMPPLVDAAEGLAAAAPVATPAGLPPVHKLGKVFDSPIHFEAVSPNKRMLLKTPAVDPVYNWTARLGLPEFCQAPPLGKSQFRCKHTHLFEVHQVLYTGYQKTVYLVVYEGVALIPQGMQ